jgi:hypothetical protein
VPARLPFRLPGETHQGLVLLIERGRLADAALLLAYALPEREAVWWSSMCVRGICRALSDEGNVALNVAEAWVRNPFATLRPALAEATKGAGYETPAGYVARAAYAARADDAWSSRAGRRIERGIGVMLDAIDAAGREHVLRLCVESGCDIAAGGAGWIRATASPGR